MPSSNRRTKKTLNVASMPILEILESPSSARLVNQVITQGLEKVKVNEAQYYFKRPKLKSESQWNTILRETKCSENLKVKVR